MTVLYCSMNDVVNVLSQSGVDLRLDDIPPAPTDGDVLNDASTIIDEFCANRYSPTWLVQSDWIRHRCKNIAAFLLCERRGNPVPSGVQTQWDRYVGDGEHPG